MAKGRCNLVWEDLEIELPRKIRVEIQTPARGSHAVLATRFERRQKDPQLTRRRGHVVLD